MKAPTVYRFTFTTITPNGQTSTTHILETTDYYIMGPWIAEKLRSLGVTVNPGDLCYHHGVRLHKRHTYVISTGGGNHDDERFLGVLDIMEIYR